MSGLQVSTRKAMRARWRTAMANHAPAPSRAPDVVDVRTDTTASLASSPARPLVTQLAARVLAADVLAVVVSTTAVGLLVGGLSALGAVLTLAVWFVGLYRLGGYDDRRLVESPVGGWALFSAAGRVALPVALMPIVLPDFSPVPYLALLLALVAATTLTRAGFTRWIRRHQAAGTYMVPAVLRGPAQDVTALMRALARYPAQPYSVVAIQVTSGSLTSDLAVDATRDPVAVADECGAAAVILVGAQPEPTHVLRRSVWRLESAGLQVAWVPLPVSIAVPAPAEIGRTGIPMLTLEDRDLSPEHSVRKIIVDRSVSVLATVLLAPFIALTALAIKLDSPGPVFFRQTRVGRGGKPFTMYKFRTMHDGAEKELDEVASLNVHEGGTLFKIPEDPRVTRTGKILRKLSLDELPQLFNIVRGDMSLVGPRPPLPIEVAHYADDLHRRFLVRPGLTGLWQVSGRSDLDPVESARLDAYYVEHWSAMLDTRILLKTVKVVLAGDGAY